MIVQKKQAQVQQAKYAAVHESRGHDDRRTAAELSARLQKLRTEHQDTTAQAAAQLTSGPVSVDEGQKPLAPIKEKKPWPAKVQQPDHILALQRVSICNHHSGRDHNDQMKTGIKMLIASYFWAIAAGPRGGCLPGKGSYTNDTMYLLEVKMLAAF